MKTMALLAVAALVATPLAAQNAAQASQDSAKKASAQADSMRRSTMGAQARQMPDSVKKEKVVQMADSMSTMADSMKGMADSMKKMADPDKKVENATVQLPTGWMSRTDNDKAAEFKFAAMGNGWHVTTGPASVFWRNTDRVTGDFHASATLIQTKAPTHPEAYGLIFGGDALNGQAQKYTYFLVRGDGKFLVKSRNGAETSNVTSGWMDNAAIVKADAAGKASNKLEIVATGDKVSFMANGTQVYEMTATPAQINGIVGLRINHNLDVHVDNFEVMDM